MPTIKLTSNIDKLIRCEKIHTIRKNLPYGWEKGKPLSLYSSKHPNKLIDTFCGDYVKLLINSDEKSVLMKGSSKFESDLNLCALRIKEMSRDEGFYRVGNFWKAYDGVCYLCYFDMERFTPTQWALEALEKGVF